MNNSLQHVGIMGMRWGHRKSSSSVPSADHTTSRMLKKKKLHEMSNSEIQTLTNRMQLERTYKNLNPGKVAKGKKKVLAALAVFGAAKATYDFTSKFFGDKRTMDTITTIVAKGIVASKKLKG